MIRWVLAVAVLLSGCAGMAGGEGSPLTGRTFTSTEVTGHALVAGTRIRLAFPENGKLTAHAGCNRLTGNVSVEGDRLSVSELGSTALGCQPERHEQDAWLAGFLKSGPRFTLRANELVLTVDNETVTSVDQASPMPGTRWAVESLLDGQSASSIPQGAFVQFDGETVTGNDGCNPVSGKAIHGQATITFSDLVFAATPCAQDRAALQAAVHATLTGQVTANLRGNVLELRAANGKGLQLRATSS